MSAHYQKQDLRHYLSTTPEADYGVAVDEDDFDLELRMADDQVQESVKRTPYSNCGAEGFDGSTDEQFDADLRVQRVATPDSVGLFQLYLLGIPGYSVTGSADPWLHEFRAVPAGTYELGSLSLIESFKGSSEYWRYRGGLLVSGGISGSMDGDKRIQLTGALEFAGERESVTLADPPECLPEKPYRLSAATINFGKFEMSATSGLIWRSFNLTHDNKPETRDEVERASLFIANRERGDRSDGVKLECACLGKKGDATDQFFQVGDSVFWDITLPNPVANRSWLISMLKGVITAKTEGWSTSVNKSTHQFTITPLRDVTSTTTSARWPWYSTLQSGRATYAA